VVLFIARGEKMESTSSNVLALTQKLLEFIERIESRFIHTQENKVEPDFFNEVKPFADEVHALLLEWEKETLEWIAITAPKYIHSQQIVSTVENVNHVTVQCFYQDTREIRFKGMIQSIRYVLNDILSKK
jgi:hypothetical protein